MRQLWAKLGANDNADWHPLVCHCLDTAAVISALWNQGLPGGTKRRMALALGEPDLTVAGLLISFWGSLHDLGKASPGFQMLSRAHQTRLEAQGFRFARARHIPHGIVTAITASDLLQGPHAQPGVADALARALGGHHGHMPAGAELSQSGRAIGTGRWDEARRELCQTMHRLLCADLPTIPPGLSPRDHPFYLSLAGLVCVADWIASSQDHFPYCPDPSDLDAYLTVAGRRAQEVLSQIGWLDWAGTGEALSLENLLSGEAPRPMQAEVAKIASGLDAPGLVLVEAPMGEGKTEAALLLVDHWGRTLQQRGCYLGLPTQATANAMFDRFADGYLKQRYPDGPAPLARLHGNAVLVAKRQLLAGINEVHDSDVGAAASIQPHEWFSYRKRGLLGPFGVGTADQALMGGLRARHSFVRLFGLADKTLVFDEVHAFDTYTSTIIDRLLQWAASLGCSVVLLSATLPRCRRAALLRAYGGEELVVPDASYPRVTWVTRGEAHSVHCPAAHRRRITLKWVPSDLAETARLLADRVRTGGCAAWVCNTVGRAQEAYRLLRNLLEGCGDVELGLLHARMPFAERDRRERKAIGQFGKDRSHRPPASILVATQVIEQSLDLDFDLMVTDTAPVDLILQRSGRLHRHYLPSRPAGLDEPTLWLVGPEIAPNGMPDFGTSGSIYGSYLLLRTWALLRHRVEIILPDDVEHIIEAVYGEGSDLVEGPLARAMNEAEQEEAQRRQSLEVRAKQVLLHRPDIDEDFASLTQRMELRDEEDPGLHQAFRAMTRYSDVPSVTIVCLHRIGGNLCVKQDGESVPVDMNKLDDDATLVALLDQSVSISGWRVHQHFTKHDDRSPPWKRNSLLRHTYPAVFDENGVCRCEDFTIYYDGALGIVLRYSHHDGGDQG